MREKEVEMKKTKTVEKKERRKGGWEDKTKEN